MNNARDAGRHLALAVTAVAAVAAPWLDLAIRLWLAQAFLVVQVHEMMAGAAAGALAGPLGVAWWYGALHGVMVSSLGLAIQTVCPLLLAVGLGARLAALAMLVQALLLPLGGTGAGADTQLLWTPLLLRIVVLGGGTYSLDRMLRPGLASSAIPGASMVARGFAMLSLRGMAIYLLGLRLWVAAALAGLALAALGVTTAMLPGAAWGLPQVPPMVASLAPGFAVLAAVLLASGVATRLTAAGLLVLVPLGHVGGVGDARLPWILLLGLLVVHGAGALSLDRLLAGLIGRRMARQTRQGWRMSSSLVAGSAASRPCVACVAWPAASPSSTGAITICSSRCCIRCHRTAVAGRYCDTRSRDVPRPGQCAGRAR